MTCQHSSSGDPDCELTACRTRWLVGTTTGEPYSPCPMNTLVLDILETWCGEWFTTRQIVDHTLRIRPNTDVESITRTVRTIRTDGGGWMFGKWAAVMSQPDPIPEFTDIGFLLRMPHRSYW